MLDYVDLQGTDAAVMRKLGAGLAKMHLAEPKHKYVLAFRAIYRAVYRQFAESCLDLAYNRAFGFVMDGCCGACPQKNNPEMRQVRRHLGTSVAIRQVVGGVV